MATFSLLSLSYANPALLGPVHLIALLDPAADWLKKWMVSTHMYMYTPPDLLLLYMCMYKVVLYSQNISQEKKIRQA